MPKENNMKASFDAFKVLSSDLRRHLRQEYVGTSPDMPLKKIAELAASSKTMYDLFQPVINEAKLANPLLKAVVEGDPKQLMKLVKKNPAHLFKKGQITDPSGQVFYNVSAYQMMKYLCDVDMLAKVMPLVPETVTNEQGVPIIDFKVMQKEQEQSLHHGGADLIKLNVDPSTLVGFDQILQHTETYTMNYQPHRVIFPLMENPDAILYYKDYKEHWYYANRETRTIEPIQPQLKTKEDAVIFDKLKASMDAMENNSARRSSDAEHDIIAKAMKKSLVRCGIQYEHEGKRYCDTRHDFNRYYNAYRECFRLYAENKYKEGDKVWREKLGTAQKEVMWLLQRYCEKNRPLFPLRDYKSSPFIRGFQIDSGIISNQLVDVYSDGCFIRECNNSDFALLKARSRVATAWAGLAGFWGERAVETAAPDLIAINRLVENAKTNVVEFKLEQGLSQDAPRLR